MGKAKLQVTKELIESNLPTLSDKFSYQVERFSPLVWRVWVMHHENYDYACGNEVKTIHSFIKSDGSVMKPTNSEKISRNKVCDVLNIPQSMNLTVITPKYATLKTLFD